MPPLRAAAILALLLSGGCGGGTASWSARFDLMAPAPGEPKLETKLSVVAWRGKVVLRNGEPGRIDVTATGKAPVDWGGLLGSAVTVARDGARIVVDESGKDVAIDLEIAAPPGISVSCACAEAKVEVSGSWSRIEIRTAGGDIAASVDGTDDGVLESRSGAVLYAPRKGPTGELRASSTKGNVAVRLPAAWNGQIHATTHTGALDVPPHGRLRTIWDEDQKGLVGHVGPQHRKGEPLAVVWGTSANGVVSFRLLD